MADSLSNAAGKLRESAARLNRLTDEAGVMVKRVEEFLGEECSVGIRAFVNIRQGSESGEESQWLEYRRVGSRFRIAVVWGCNDDPGPENEIVKPWSDCSREDKLATIKKLPDLISEVAKKLDRNIAEAETTMKSVSNALGTFAGKGD